MANGKIGLEIGSVQGDVAYVSLQAHPGKRPGVVAKVVWLSTLIPDYKGPEVMLEFAEGNQFIGFEILG